MASIKTLLVFMQYCLAAKAHICDMSLFNGMKLFPIIAYLAVLRLARREKHIIQKESEARKERRGKGATVRQQEQCDANMFALLCTLIHT